MKNLIDARPVLLILGIGILVTGCSGGNVAPQARNAGDQVGVDGAKQTSGSSEAQTDSKVNRPVGGQMEVVSSGQKLVLNYDLKKTIDKAVSTKWSCKCKVREEITIDGKHYTVFGDCGSQNGNQLILQGGRYFLVSKKLVVLRSGGGGSGFD